MTKQPYRRSTEPAKNQPGGEPARNQPGGEPARNQPGGEPAKNQPGAEPAGTRREHTAPGHPAPGPVRRTDSPDPVDRPHPDDSAQGDRGDT
ncbi:hypothetical protein EDD94_6232 [Streptomyces sp. PanSC9]|nr:hypothetical protein EDD94_6232 [Streptomyces sp. PanSC9]